MFDRLRYLFAKQDKETFAQLCIDALRRANFEGRISRNDSGDSLCLSPEAEEAEAEEEEEEEEEEEHSGDGDKKPGLHLGLNNFYRDFFTSSRWQRARVMGRMVRTTLAALNSEGVPSFDKAQGQLLPALRDGFLLEATALRAKLRGEELPDAWVPTRPFASGSRIALLLVLDKPESVLFVQQQALNEWGKAFDELVDIAVANLGAITQGALTLVAPGVYQAPWFDDHDVARLLLDETLRGLDIDGDPVVVMPTRNHLFVTGLHNEQALEQMLLLAEQTSATQPSLISNLPLVRRWPKWEALKLAPTHPAYATWCRLRVEELGGLFGEQKALLDTISEGDDDADFVGSYRVIERKDVGLQSFAQWTRTVHILLPEADLIAFYDTEAPEDDQLFFVPWAQAHEICGSIMKPWGSGLPRWRVDAFPDDGQIAALRALSF